MCLDDSVGVFFWISQSERGGGCWWAVAITRYKASKAGSDRRYTDIHVTAERIDRLVIFEND